MIFFTPTHFRDYYNFDSKDAGKRNNSDETATRLGSFIPGVPFWIKYP